jgi:hypothetical protein
MKLEHLADTYVTCVVALFVYLMFISRSVRGLRMATVHFNIIHPSASSECLFIFSRKNFVFNAFSSPITVAARSKAWTVFARSNTEIVVSNPTRGMDVCAFILCFCSVCKKRSFDGLIPRPRSPVNCV